MNNQYAEMHNSNTDKGISIIALGIDLETYIDYDRYITLDKKEYTSYIRNFEDEKAGVIITTALNKMIDKKVGETVQITCNGQKRMLKIAGIIDGKLQNNGYFVFIKNSTMKEQYGIPSANTITFNTDQDLDEVLTDLKPILREIGASAITRDEMCENNLKNNEMIVNALSIFSYMAIIIAALGIVNNVSISFLQRKNEFAILSSVGMEDVGRIKILLFESIASVSWAMLFTTIYSIFGIKLITVMGKSIGFDMVISLDYKSLPMIYIISLIIVLIASIPVCFKSRKLSIIQELKYE